MDNTETKLLRAIVHVMFIIISYFIITLETMSSLFCYWKEIKFHLFYETDLWLFLGVMREEVGVGGC